MNVNEYGVIYRHNAQLDMSGASAFSLAFTKPSGAVLTVTDPDVTLGITAFSNESCDFPANEYIKYTFVSGDVSESGVWSARLTVDFGPDKRLISDEPVQFSVDP